ncbi:uncharacterized protein TNCV_858821 [Trichonephila clavipes]|nr:uncharacterized protein TNCV_858821 [Trichonephila clavipes]
METIESASWAETPLQFISRHQPEGFAALVVDESECVVIMDTLWFRYPLVAPHSRFNRSSLVIVHPWWYCDGRIYRRHGFLLQSLWNRILFETYKSETCFKHFSFVMDPIDAFPEHLSTTVVPVTLADKPDALEYAARQGQVRAGIIYQEPTAKRVFVLFCKDHWHQKKTWLDNFKRAVMEAKHLNEFRPNDVMWEKTSKGLLRNPDRLLKNTDKRMVYIYNNIFFAKKDFTFGLRTVKSGEIHLIQTTHVPMLIYELPASSLKCRAQPNVIRRSFEPHDQMLYHRTILEPHTAYPIPAGTHYISASQTFNTGAPLFNHNFYRAPPYTLIMH